MAVLITNVFIISVFIFIVSLSISICIDSIDKCYYAFMNEEKDILNDMITNKGYFYKDAFDNRINSCNKDNITKKEN